MRFLTYDLKRMFSGKSLVLMCIFSPIVVVLLFSLVVAPMIYTANGLHFNLAICDEDKSEEVNQFIRQMVNSQALADIVDVYPVGSVDIGLTLVENDDVSVLIHIPKDFFENMKNGNMLRVPIYAKKSHALESKLISMSLNSSLALVGKSQNVMESAQEIIVDLGESEENAEIFLDDATSAAITDYMNRREVFGEGGALSPMGEYMPVEYYLSAIFSLFAALSMLPIIHFSAVDVSGAILRRGLLCGMGSVRFFLTRIVSGACFVLLVQLMLFPTSFLLRIAGDVLGGVYASSFPALFLSLMLSSICYSTLALFIATLLPNETTALWTGFFLALAMAVFCGALVPESTLPGWATIVGKWLPLRSSMRMLSVSLFKYDQMIFNIDVLKTGGFTIGFLIFGFLCLRRRGERS